MTLHHDFRLVRMTFNTFEALCLIVRAVISDLISVQEKKQNWIFVVLGSIVRASISDLISLPQQKCDENSVS